MFSKLFNQDEYGYKNRLMDSLTMSQYNIENLMEESTIKSLLREVKIKAKVFNKDMYKRIIKAHLSKLSNFKTNEFTNDERAFYKAGVLSNILKLDTVIRFIVAILFLGIVMSLANLMIFKKTALLYPTYFFGGISLMIVSINTYKNHVKQICEKLFIYDNNTHNFTLGIMFVNLAILIINSIQLFKCVFDIKILISLGMGFILTTLTEIYLRKQAMHIMKINDLLSINGQMSRLSNSKAETRKIESKVIQVSFNKYGGEGVNRRELF